MPIDPRRVQAVFLVAVEQTERSARAAVLDRECSGDNELRRRVEALLRANDEPGSYLDQPAVGLPDKQAATEATTGFEATQSYTSADPTPGVVIAGRYTLEQKLGEGGMGEVWVAKQSEPVKRKVALKLIKAGMDSKSVVQRFEQERQALAMMDHPNIAKVLDGGITADRRPFFVMELVNGLPLTKFCDETKLGIKERLELFVPICQAVQHAHQKGIVHRDLKPGNILITMIDGKPVPKVIDFGVAKATGGKLTDESMSTQFGAVVGTLEYMSPEQAGFSGEDIDTRADIYSLGVILYELLTGLRPFDSKRLKKAALDEMIRIIREEEPSKPSTRLSTDESLPSLAASRHIEPGKLTALLRGELDWVVMKCLEKQRDRRYESANGLARDIQRYLADEVVEARPPSAGYRLQKFIHRNKGQVIAASLVLAALLAGIVGTTLGLFEARRQATIADDEKVKAIAAAEKEQQARQREAERAEGEKKAKDEAIRNLEFARKGNDILGSVFVGLDPQADYRTVAELRNALRDNLTNAVKELDGSAIGDPLDMGAMQYRLGVSLMNLGEIQHAITVLTKARDTAQAQLGPDHPITLNSSCTLAICYVMAGQTDLALPLHKETLERRKVTLGPDHPQTLHSMHSLALGYRAAGQLDLALPLLKETLDRRKVTLGSDHADTLRSMYYLALGYKDAGQLDLALPLLKKALERMKDTLGPDNHDTIACMSGLAKGYVEIGQFDLALPLSKDVLERRRARFGFDHHSTLSSMDNLAECYRQMGQPALAVSLYKEALERFRATAGPDHPSTLITMGNLALGYKVTGHLSLALPLYQETLERKRAKLGPDHPEVITSMNNLALGYDAAGQLDKALPILEEAARAIEKRQFRHMHAKLILPNTIAAYEEARQYQKADEWRRKWLGFVREQAGIESPAYAGELLTWGLDLLKQQKWVEAEAVLRECLAIREKFQPDIWSTFNAQSLLGGSLLGQKKYTDAEPLLRKGYEGMKAREKSMPPRSPRIPEALDRLIQFYTETNKPDEVKKWQAEKEKLPKATEKK